MKRIRVALEAIRKLITPGSDIMDIYAFIEAIKLSHYCNFRAKCFRNKTALINQAFTDELRIKIKKHKIKTCAPGTIGNELCLLYSRYSTDPYDIPEFSVKNEGDYLFALIFDSHDFHHVITGFGHTIEGEIGVLGYYFVHAPFEGPLVFASIIFIRTLLFEPWDIFPRLRALVKGVRIGMRSRNSLGIDWNDLLNEPIAKIRNDLGIVL